MIEASPTRRSDWFNRRNAAVAIAAIIAVVVAGQAVYSRRGDNDTLAPSNRTEQVDGPTDTFPIQDGDWRLDSFEPNDSGLGSGSFGGSGRVTYTGDDAEGGTGSLFVTIFRDGRQVAYVTGVTKFVRPGATEDVLFLSSDKYVFGPYTYEFKGPEPYTEPTTSYGPG